LTASSCTSSSAATPANSAGSLALLCDGYIRDLPSCRRCYVCRLLPVLVYLSKGAAVICCVVHLPGDHERRGVGAIRCLQPG
jgi:hypothetical protein